MTESKWILAPSGPLDIINRVPVFLVSCIFENPESLRRPVIKIPYFEFNPQRSDYHLVLTPNSLTRRRRDIKELSPIEKASIDSHLDLTNSKVIECEQRVVGNPDCRDFQLLGKYALERLPKLASQVSTFYLDHQLYNIELIEQVKREWQNFQAQSSGLFYRAFAESAFRSPFYKQLTPLIKSLYSLKQA